MGRNPSVGVESIVDLELYTSAVRNHRLLVTVGAVLSLVLAVLAFVRVSPSGVEYRTSERWTNQATLLLTQAGFREGRSLDNGASDAGLLRLASLVDLYAALVESDEVVDLLVKRRLVERKDVDNGELPVVATPVVASSGASTPLLKISGSGRSPEEATALTIGATKAFVDALQLRQETARIPPAQRTLVQVVRRSAEPQLVEPRSKSLPIVVFLAGLSATIAAALLRERRSSRLLGPKSESIAMPIRDMGESLPIRAAREAQPSPSTRWRSPSSKPTVHASSTATSDPAILQAAVEADGEPGADQRQAPHPVDGPPAEGAQRAAQS